MASLDPILAVGALGGLSVSELSGLLTAAIVAGLLTALALLAGYLWRTRRRLVRETREIVQALEEIRQGHTRRMPHVSASSPLALASDAVHRLGREMHQRLAEAERAAERWQTLGEAFRDTAIITTDNDGDIRSFSVGATRLFGWNEEDVVSRPAALVFEESSYKDLLPKLARKSLRRHGITTRARLTRRDGSSFSAEVSVRTLHGASQEPIGFLMAVRDITQDVQLETELREAEARYRGLVEGLAEGVLIVKEGRLAYANPAAEQLCGSTSAELIGAPLRRHVATGDVLVVEERVAALADRAAGGEELRCTLVAADGTQRSAVRMHAGAVQYEGGPAVLLLIQDESARQRIEAELRHNETRLDAVLEATSDGIVVLPDERHGGAIQMTNRAFAELFGLGLSEILGASEVSLLRLLRERGAGAEAAAALIAAAADAPRRDTIVLGDAPDARELVLSVSPLYDANGEGLGRVVACRDLTEQRMSERQLQAHAEKLQLSKVELEQAYRSLNEVNRKLQLRGEDLDRLNQELRRLDEMKSKLLGNVSHELQTPLVSIRGYTEMILKERLGPISEEQRKGLALSLKNIDRLISMIDNLMSFARSDSAPEGLKLTRVPLKRLLDEAVDLMRGRMDARQIRLSRVLESDEIEIQVDRDRILQVFVNLLSNAVKYNRPGGEIAVTVRRRPAGYATVGVRDTGVGIPEVSLGRIFDRHYQVGGAPRAEGSGIGLAIVRDVLRLHGCTIHVESREGHGSEFTFTLPLAEPERGVAQAIGQPGPEAVPPSPQEPREEAPAPPPTPRPGRPRPRFRIIRRFGKKEGESSP